MEGGRRRPGGAVVETVAGDGARACRDGSLLQASLAFPYGLCWENCAGQTHEQSHGVLLVSEYIRVCVCVCVCVCCVGVCVCVSV
jgi:hypothetical protein